MGEISQIPNAAKGWPRLLTGQGSPTEGVHDRTHVRMFRPAVVHESSQGLPGGSEAELVSDTAGCVQNCRAQFSGNATKDIHSTLPSYGGRSKKNNTDLLSNDSPLSTFQSSLRYTPSIRARAYLWIGDA